MCFIVKSSISCNFVIHNSLITDITNKKQWGHGVSFQKYTMGKNIPKKLAKLLLNIFIRSPFKTYQLYLLVAFS